MGVTYSNGTTKPIMIAVSCELTSGSISTVGAYINGALYFEGKGNYPYEKRISLVSVVPSGNSYSFKVTSGACSLQKWSELR